MTAQKAQNFVRSLSSVCLGPLSDVVSDILERGRFPVHSFHTIHEEDGGHDERGVRPQKGIEILREELDALTFRDGVAFARDDVSGNSRARVGPDGSR